MSQLERKRKKWRPYVTAATDRKILLYLTLIPCSK